MRFLVQPAAASRAQPPVRIFLVFAALAIAGFAAQRALGGGLVPARVEAFYLGGGEGEALSAVALWEEVHTGAFVYGFVLFVLASLLAFCPVPPRVRGWLVGTAFVATLADLFAPFLIVATRAGGALRVVTFVGATGSLVALLVVVAARFGREGGDGRA